MSNLRNRLNKIETKLKTIKSDIVAKPSAYLSRPYVQDLSKQFNDLNIYRDFFKLEYEADWVCDDERYCKKTPKGFN